MLNISTVHFRIPLKLFSFNLFNLIVEFFNIRLIFQHYFRKPCPVREARCPDLIFDRMVVRRAIGILNPGK